MNRVRDLPAVLERLASLIETAESEWHQVELSSSTLPRTLVHGDFVGKNLRIQPGRLGRDVVVFDWEYARFGNPAADLAQFAEGQAASPDLEAYRLAVRHRWPRLGVAEIEWMAHTGTVFWLLGNVDRACWSLDRGFEETASAELRLYRDGLAQVCGALGWWRGSLV